MKKALALLLSAGMIFNLTACSVSLETGEETTAAEVAETDAADASGKKFSGRTIEVADLYTGEISVMFSELVADFEEETGCTVQISEYGNDYENTLKTRMASNTLPDVFQTHGWSILRYKEYLEDLRDEPWVADYDESALGVIQDEDGAIYVLMVSEVANGTLVNLDICEEAGVNVYDIHTWADFEAACQKIKDAGYTPIGSASNPGRLANIAGTWVSYDGEMAQDSEAMLNGTYDWKSFDNLLQFSARCLDNGYFWEDLATIPESDCIERFAMGKSAFMIGNGVTQLKSCYDINPEGNFAFLPSFASKEGGQEFVGIGEGDTFGVWKDSPNKDVAKAFLEFLSRPENVVRITGKTGNIACLKSAMEIDDNKGLEFFNTMQEKCTDCDIRYENLWDRKYMPSGMWQVFGIAWEMLMEDRSEDGLNKIREHLAENYKDLYEMAQE